MNVLPSAWRWIGTAGRYGEGGGGALVCMDETYAVGGVVTCTTGGGVDVGVGGRCDSGMTCTAGSGKRVEGKTAETMGSDWTRVLAPKEDAEGEAGREDLRI